MYRILISYSIKHLNTYILCFLVKINLPITFIVVNIVWALESKPDEICNNIIFTFQKIMKS